MDLNQTISDQVFIVMPAYNEAVNIEQTICEWHRVVEKTGPHSRLIVFNDGSSDNTFAIMQQIKQKYPQFIPITKLNTGHGATCLYSYNYCIEAGIEYVFQTDSDGQTNPEEFWRFWEKRKDYDFIIGTRNKRKDGLFRIITSRILQFIVYVIFGKNIKDANTPFRLMKITKLKPILNLIPLNYFLANVMISLFVVKRSESYLRIPITFQKRKAGVNSINLRRIIVIGYNAIGDFYTIKQNTKELIYGSNSEIR